MIEETLQVYAQQDPPPSRLDAGAVLGEARRRTRRRTRLVAAAAGAAVVLATVGAAAVVRPGGSTPAGAGCVVDRLDLPAGVAGAAVNGIDPSGRYLIGVAGTTDAPRAVLWTDDVATILPGSFVPKAVNTSGLVVGYTGAMAHGGELGLPAVYDGTRLVPLPMPDGGVRGAAYAVSSHGDVLGTATRRDGTWISVRWRTGGTVAIASTVTGVSGLGLSDDGVAVGHSATDTRAMRWSADGVTSPLPVPDGLESIPAAAQGDWAVGDAMKASSDDKGDLVAQAALRWNLRTGAVEQIRGISGQRVSASGSVTGMTPEGLPALWHGDRISTLPLPAGGVAFGGSVTGITADGHSVAGNVQVPAGPVATSAPNAPVTEPWSVAVVWHGC